MNTYEAMGVDVNRHWIVSNDDVVLIDGYENLYQAIFNRITCVLNDMAYFYTDYGSRVHEYFGEVMNKTTFKNLAEEVYTRLLEEPRISEPEVSVIPNGRNTVIIHITANIFNNDQFVGNFVLDTTTHEFSYVGGVYTYMTLQLGEWNCKMNNSQRIIMRGEPFKLKCYIKDKHGCNIPIGMVDFIRNNTIFASVEVEHGYAEVDFTFPSNTMPGTYSITVQYRGVGKFNSCSDKIKVNVVDKYPTLTKFNYEYLQAYQGQQVSFPATIKNIQGGLVTDGTLEYSLKLDEAHKLATTLTINNMFTREPTSNHALFENITLFNGLGEPLDNENVTLYITNGEGFMKATNTIINNVFYDKNNELNSGFYSASVTDNMGQKVLTGDIDYSLRKQEILDTSTTLPHETKTYHGIPNLITSETIDSDGLGVTSGETEYFARRCGRCKPYKTKTVIDNAALVENGIVGNAKVTDEDELNINKGVVDFCYNLTGLPVGLTSNTKLTKGKRMAMIVDETGAILDAGELLTENDGEKQISNYVSSDNIDINDENIVSLTLKGVNNEKKDRN